MPVWQSSKPQQTNMSLPARANEQPQMNCQVIECDDQTADRHMATAQMMADDEKQVEQEMKPEEQINLMQFSAVQDDTYGNQDNIYDFQINDFT